MFLIWNEPRNTLQFCCSHFNFLDSYPIFIALDDILFKTFWTRFQSHRLLSEIDIFPNFRSAAYGLNKSNLSVKL